MMICTADKTVGAECHPMCCNSCNNCSVKCPLSDQENKPCQWELSYEQILELQHFKTTVVGLWATDRPDLLYDEEKLRCHLFEIK